MHVRANQRAPRHVRGARVRATFKTFSKKMASGTKDSGAVASGRALWRAEFEWERDATTAIRREIAPATQRCVFSAMSRDLRESPPLSLRKTVTKTWEHERGHEIAAGGVGGARGGVLLKESGGQKDEQRTTSRMVLEWRAHDAASLRYRLNWGRRLVWAAFAYMQGRRTSQDVPARWYAACPNQGAAMTVPGPPSIGSHADCGTEGAWG